MKTKIFFIISCVLLIFLYNSTSSAQNKEAKTREQKLMEELPEGFELKEYSIDDLVKHKWRSQLSHLPDLDFQYTYNKNGLMTLYAYSKAINYQVTSSAYFYLSNTLDTVFDKNKITNTKGKYITSTIISDTLGKVYNQIILSINDSTFTIAPTKLPNNPDRMRAIIK